MASGNVDVQALLKTFRDNPEGNKTPDESQLRAVYDDLMENTPTGRLIAFHWFCSQANGKMVEEATYLIRLFAYKSDLVVRWKERFSLCVSRCPECVLGLEKAKVNCRNTYLSAFPDSSKDNFFEQFGKWELECCITDLTNTGFLPTCANSLFNAPPAVVYRMVANSWIFHDQRILDLLHSDPPEKVILDWPHPSIPVGLFILSLDADQRVRKWAADQMEKASPIPLSDDQFLPHHRQALKAIVEYIASQLSSVPPSEPPPYPFTSDPLTLWRGFDQIIRVIPNEIFDKSPISLDIRRLVSGHVHDKGPEFQCILRCLLILVKRLGQKLWTNESSDYPQVVFDALKDNSAFLDLVLTFNSSQDKVWCLSWFASYLKAIPDERVHSDVLAKMSDFLCEELQHERFGNIRPFAMLSVAKLLTASWAETIRRETVADIVDIHSNSFVEIAFRRSQPQWKNAKAAVRELFAATLTTDTDRIAKTISALSQYLADVTRGKTNARAPSPLTLRAQFWKRVYESIEASDPAAISLIISVVVRLFYLDHQKSNAFRSRGDKPELQLSLHTTVNQINKSLLIVQDGFLEAVTRFSDNNTSSTALELLQNPEIVKALIKLLLSPIENSQSAAQNLVGLAFDVDVRLDCFRALLENHADASFDGLFEFLGKFIEHATLVPEACNVSKSMVRCFTDIIEVLCATPNGLLRSSIFLRSSDKNGPAARLPRLWKLMARAITVIFKRTPSWAEYVESEVMVLWMRDALIFCRDMLAQRRVMETAATSHVSDSTTNIGKKMLSDLQDVLQELARWLRLTDEELLHQSFSLLQSLLDTFRESKVPPPKAGIEKLTRIVTDARKNDAKRNSRLDDSRLDQLANALASFDEEDDEIEIVAFNPPPKPQLVESNQTQKVVPPTKPSVPADIPKQIKQKKAIPPQPSSSRARPFTDDDQRRLDASTARPIYRPSASSIIPAKPHILPKLPVGPRNEGGRATTKTPEESEVSEDDDSDEEGPPNLEALAKSQASPKIRKPEPRRQVKPMGMILTADPLAEHRRNRELARRNALRMKPDLSSLHKALLSWDYNHTGDDPPGFTARLRQVPYEFKDYKEYFQVFQPLLLLECWQQLQQGKAESQESYECTVSGRRFVDEYLEFDFTIEGSVDSKWWLTDADVVLLKRLDGDKLVMAKTETYRATAQSIQGSLKCLASSDPGLQPQSKWRLSKIFSLSTLHREYGALMSVQYYDFCDMILRPRLPRLSAVDPHTLKQTMSKFQVNEPQAAAISSALKTDGFSLIQGPPGTGKTSTICALISAFLESRPVNIAAGKTTEKSPASKVLVCAPSNAAIDEVASRIKEMFKGTSAPNGQSRVVRVGAVQGLNIAVKDISMDALVENLIEPGQKTSKDGDNQIKALYNELETLKAQQAAKIKEKDSVVDNSARTQTLSDEIQRLVTRRHAVRKQLNDAKDNSQTEHRAVNAARRSARKQVLTNADVICTTLSGAAHETLDDCQFDLVIIDEAAQAIELSSLIPLRYSFKRCVMVGDPQQLPPTVLSKKATNFQYSQSLFVRLHRNQVDSVHLLSIQYRMHPQISLLPSSLFYGGRLMDGPNMEVKTRQPWHDHPKLGIYRFYNVTKGLEENVGKSLKNSSECDIAVALYRRITVEFKKVDIRIGVVSMYKAQIRELQRIFESAFGLDVTKTVDFNTVDGFQGQEKDVIILSCVRAGPGLQNIGFLTDLRRMNVALTRAKSSMFILGHASTLERSDDTWKAIIADARSRNALVDNATPAYFISPTTTTSATPTSPRKVKASRSSTSMATAPADLVPLKESKSKKTTSSDRMQGIESTNALPRENKPLKRKLSKETIDDKRERAAPTPIAGPSRPTETNSRPPKPPKPKPPKEKSSIFIPKKKPRPQ